MADGAHIKVSTAEVRSEIAKDTCPIQSTSGQMHETELSEGIRQIESEIGGNKQEKISVAVSSIVNDQQQPISEIAGKTSLPEQFRFPPEDVRKSSQSENGSCQHVTTLEQTHELDSGNVCTKLVEEHLPGFEQTNEVAPEDIGTEPSKQHRSASDHKPDEPMQTIAAVSSSIIGNNLDSPSVSVSMNSLINEVELSREDVSMRSQTGNCSCTQHATLEQIYECGAGSTCNELSDQKHHLRSDLLQNELGRTNSAVPYSAVNKKLEMISRNENLRSDKQLAVPSEDVTKNFHSLRSSCPQETTSEHNFHSGGVHSMPPEQKDQLCSVNVEYVPVETRTAVSDSIITEHLGLSLVATTESSPVGQLEPPLGDITKSPNDKQLETSSEDVTKKSSLEQSQTPPKIVMKNSSRLGHKDKRTTKSRKKKYMLRSLVGNDRVLRSRTREKPKALESSTNLGNDCNGGKKGRKKRKRKGKRITTDEFSRIRTHLRYLLNRIGYEQNLIDAYSGEGWKGYRCLFSTIKLRCQLSGFLFVIIEWFW